ncbi:23S rRNA (cytidine2498-2'-O)-methyltransferase [Desulfonatronum zhilinae]|nr:23S rRNA (cytidine2498-2'-O)-methyltransferase [Desulfonatronum zhilinae]
MGFAVPRGGVGYLAPEGFLPELLRELGAVEGVLGRLALCAAPFAHPVAVRPITVFPATALPATVLPAWAQNIWHDLRVIPFTSIAQAATALKGLGPRWALYDEHLPRRGRARLIQQRLRGPSSRPLVFGDPLPKLPLGSWTLLDDTTLLASPHCSSPFAHGEALFAEDKTGPPSRAYLKLWEVFTLLDRRPRPGQLCLDLGSSPGGWTWVLHELGARVISVDKAPLDARLAGLPGITFRAESAFAQDPQAFGPVDWLFSDVVCYPERLLAMVRRWLDAGTVRNMVCTIKFQGETDFQVVDRFRSIPHSRLLHLAHNKHELTWVCIV